MSEQKINLLQRRIDELEIALQKEKENSFHVECDNVICFHCDVNKGEEKYNNPSGKCVCPSLSTVKTSDDLTSDIVNCSYFRPKDNWKKFMDKYPNGNKFYSVSHNKIKQLKKENKRLESLNKSGFKRLAKKNANLYSQFS